MLKQIINSIFTFKHQEEKYNKDMFNFLAQNFKSLMKK
jgi:hypothetical protein